MCDGLGFLAASACPHYDVEERRRPVYGRLVANGFPGGLAAEDGVGLHFVDTELAEVVTCRAGNSAFRVEAPARRRSRRGCWPELERGVPRRPVPAPGGWTRPPETAPGKQAPPATFRALEPVCIRHVYAPGRWTRLGKTRTSGHQASGPGGAPARPEVRRPGHRSQPEPDGREEAVEDDDRGGEDRPPERPVAQGHRALRRHGCQEAFASRRRPSTSRMIRCAVSSIETSDTSSTGQPSRRCTAEACSSSS